MKICIRSCVIMNNCALSGALEPNLHEIWFPGHEIYFEGYPYQPGGIAAKLAQVPFYT